MEVYENKATQDCLFHNNFFEQQWKKHQQEEDKRILQELEAMGKINTVVIMANPKWEDIIGSVMNEVVELSVLWSDVIEEDKIYQVMDPQLRLEIIKMNDTGREIWKN